MSNKKKHNEDSLEAFIRQNREAFDAREPDLSKWEAISSDDTDSLEQFVLDHRESFNVHIPSESVWEGIEQSILDSTPVIKLWPVYAWRAAAVVAIVLSTYAIWLNTASKQDELAQNDTPPTMSIENDLASEEEVTDLAELIEVEAFYSRQVSNRLEEVKKYAANEPAAQEVLKYDFEELDKAYLELKEDLSEGMYNEAIVEAMIQNYRLKLKILNDLLSQLKKKEVRTTENEPEQLHI